MWSYLLVPLHWVVVNIIRLYKWTELQLFRFSSRYLTQGMVKLGTNLGTVFHFSEDGDHYSPETWTAAQEKAALSKCKSKYNFVVHFQVNDKAEFFARAANTFTLGLGETFMNGMWDTCRGEEEISEYVARYLEEGYLRLYFHPANRLIQYLEVCVFNLQTRFKSTEVIDKHYDLGNDLYESFLDPYMQYTCGYWATASNLNDAQLDKLELIAKKLDLRPGMKVLDIGCGWGMLCKYLAEKHGVQCVGVTISEEQLKYARDKCKGLNVDIRIQDYRDVNEKFDRMVVVGMLEHVGFHNYNEFFKIASRNLKDDGLFLVHSIGLNHEDLPRSELFLHTYIFPNGNIPFPNDIINATKGKFIIEDWHNFGPDYVKTLDAWRDNFKQNWPTIQMKYGPKFYRMWIYYLTMCAGLFKSRRTQLWQIVLSKDGIKREYRAAR